MNLKLQHSLIVPSLFLMMACSGATTPTTTTPYVPQISFDITSINSGFQIELPSTDPLDPCAAIQGAKRACLTFNLNNNQKQLLAGDVTVPGSNNHCATATLSGDMVDGFSEAAIVDVKFELLNDPQASCQNAAALEIGGHSIGKSDLVNVSYQNGKKIFKLQFLANQQSNLFDFDQASSDPALYSGRAFHTATRLPDGRVLVTGGINRDGAVSNSTLLFSADGNSVTVGPNMLCNRFKHTATFVASGAMAGKVLLAGGAGACSASTTLEDFEIFDPQTNAISLITFNDQYGQPKRLSPARYGHQATYVASKQYILFNGGRNSTTNKVLEDGESSYALDLVTQQLTSVTEGAGFEALHGVAGHTAFVADFGTSYGELPVILSGVTDDMWNNNSYFVRAAGHLNDVNGGVYHMFTNDDLDNLQTRELSAAVRLAADKWGIIGGRLLQTNGSGSQVTLRNDVLAWSYAGGANHSVSTIGMAANLPAARIAPQTQELLGNGNFVNIIVGGGTTLASSTTGFASSRDIDLLISQNNATVNCFKTVDKINPLNGQSAPIKLVKGRYGHTMTRLNNGRFLIMGGFDGDLTGDQPDPTFIDPQQILSSYELLPTLQTAADCS